MPRRNSEIFTWLARAGRFGKLETFVDNDTYSMERMSPGEAIQGVASLDDMVLDEFENSLRQAGERCEGAVFVEFSRQSRLKLRA